MEPFSSPPKVAAASSKPRAMLRAFEVHNYRLFKRERLEVHPEVTVLVGENDVGKTTLLEAMSLYGRIAQGPRLRPALENDEFEGTGEQATRFVAEWEDPEGQRWTHSFTLDAITPEERLSCGERFWRWNSKERRLETEQGAFQAEQLDRHELLAQIEPKRWQLDTSVPAPVYGPLGITRAFCTPLSYFFEPSELARSVPTSQESPLRNGYGWVVWLQEIINRRNDDIDALESDLRSLFRFFRGVRVHEERLRIESSATETAPPRPQAMADPILVRGQSPAKILMNSFLNVFGAEDRTREVLIDITASVSSPDEKIIRIPAIQASSGLLLALAHFTLLHAAPPQELLFLEEPENGLNGKITLELIQSFLSIIRRRKQQLVLTTHHPWWLDLVPADAIRVLTRDAEGGHIKTVPRALVEANLEKSDIYPSEIMGSFGPEGLLYPRQRDR